MSMQNYTIDQLMLFIGGCSTALIGVLLAIQKSKCKTINLCCLKCERDIDAIIQEERLQMTGHTGASPRPNQLSLSESVSKKELSSESEPEPEPIL
jgi:hypothetical protein